MNLKDKQDNFTKRHSNLIHAEKKRKRNVPYIKPPAQVSLRRRNSSRAKAYRIGLCGRRHIIPDKWEREGGSWMRSTNTLEKKINAGHT